jgi:ABC-type sugar transport system ATPase subunit
MGRLERERAVITVTGVSKAFPGVRALDQVDFSVNGGEVHALLGENGSGKSTLTKIIAGVFQPDTGSIVFDGKSVRWSTPREAREAGIHVIYQELVTFREMTVAENIFIGHEPRNRAGLINYSEMENRASDVLKRLGTRLDVRAKVKALSVADQQMIEIAKALVGTIKLLILDEPSAVIAGREVELLFDRIKALRSAGVAIVYISHRLEEIFEIADRVTVLKDGKLIGTLLVGEVDRDGLVRMMVGRPLADIFPPRRFSREPAPVVLRTNQLSVGKHVKSASILLRAGEIVGLAGMIGSGRTELAMGIFGGLPITGGSVEIGDESYTGTSPRKSIARGIGLLTEDRKGEGLLLLLSIAANITAPNLKEVAHFGFLNAESESQVALEEMKNYQVAAPGPATKVQSLSGGNQQKVLFGRWVRSCERVLMLDEPTRGVDVGAKVEIYRIIRRLADSGVAILMISSELPEIVGMSDRAVVMRDGEIRGELSGADISEETIMALATHHYGRHLAGDRAHAKFATQDQCKDSCRARADRRSSDNRIHAQRSFQDRSESKQCLRAIRTFGVRSARPNRRNPDGRHRPYLRLSNRVVVVSDLGPH